eukprot:scaffold771_cov170-Amphora_coffeaeformis.AAC.19
MHASRESLSACMEHRFCGSQGEKVSASWISQLTGHLYTKWADWSRELFVLLSTCGSRCRLTTSAKIPSPRNLGRKCT